MYLGHTLLEFEECRIEPNGITWENIDISYKEFVCRTLLYLLMLLVVLTITIAVLFALTVIGNTLVDHQYDGLTELQAQIIGR